MKNEIITITAAMNPIIDKLVGTWEVYNKCGDRYCIARVGKNGKKLSPKNPNNIMALTESQMAEARAAQA